MPIIRRTFATVLAIVLFTCVAALALASPPAGNPAGGCGKGPPDGQAGPPAGQYGGPGHQYGPPAAPPGGGNGPPGKQYGPPGNQYNPGNPSPGPPNGCPTGGQYNGQYGSP